MPGVVNCQGNGEKLKMRKFGAKLLQLIFGPQKKVENLLQYLVWIRISLANNKKYDV